MSALDDECVAAFNSSMVFVIFSSKRKVVRLEDDMGLHLLVRNNIHRAHIICIYFVTVKHANCMPRLGSASAQWKRSYNGSTPISLEGLGLVLWSANQLLSVPNQNLTKIDIDNINNLQQQIQLLQTEIDRLKVSLELIH